jgi:hypothetical protein
MFFDIRWRFEGGFRETPFVDKVLVDGIGRSPWDRKRRDTARATKEGSVVVGRKIEGFYRGHDLGGDVDISLVCTASHRHYQSSKDPSAGFGRDPFFVNFGVEF